jgi:hypothetical protein
MLLVPAARARVNSSDAEASAGCQPASSMTPRV